VRVRILVLISFQIIISNHIELMLIFHLAIHQAEPSKVSELIPNVIPCVLLCLLSLVDISFDVSILKPRLIHRGFTIVTISKPLDVSQNDQLPDRLWRRPAFCTKGNVSPFPTVTWSWSDLTAHLSRFKDLYL
jgi:hypothetical protein